jgi:outer membrane protein assembly factor BamE (lipoprotein component of BamABCDE complex)
MGKNVLKKTFYLNCAACCIALLLTSCGWSEMARNNNKLLKLNKDMSKAQVLAIMGKPLEHEVYNTDNVWYYYTETKWSDGMLTRDECTPLFFKDDQLVGWGQVEYKKFCQENW